jgi:hypothetical protein
MTTDEIALTFTNEFEELLKNESEKAESMAILHIMAHEKFNSLSLGVNIPVIIVSSLIGFLSPLNIFEQQTILLGALSIIVAIAKTIDSYMDFTKRCETHRVISLNYGKISKFIEIQLALEQECRINPKDLLNYIQNDLQNLRDQEPLIPHKIIEKFNIKYENTTTARPSITNGLTIVKINKKILTPPPPPVQEQIEVPPVPQENDVVMKKEEPPKTYLKKGGWK